MSEYYSDLLTFAFTSFIVAYIVFALIKQYLNSKIYPNGPWGLPFVGYAPFLGSKPHIKLCELSKRYGPVFSLRIGDKNVVFLNDWESIKDAFSKDEILGRPKVMLGEGYFHKQRNMTVESGKVWQEQRRFAIRVFRDLGFGKQTMESNLKNEISYLMSEIEKHSSKPINIHEMITPSVSNNICCLLFGHRYDYDDYIRKRLDYIFPNILRLLAVTSVSTFFPFLYKLKQFFGNSKMNELKSLLMEFEQIVEKEVEDHEKRLNENNIEDYIDAFLVEMKQRDANNNLGSFSLQKLYANSKGFFIAGSFTVRNTLDWMFKLIADNIDVQREVHREIDSVIGTDRVPSWAENVLMPFTRAVIMETQRWASVIPLNIPRRTMSDTTVLGHFIPKDTEIVANFWGIFRDEKLWKDANTFNPRRFLNEDMNEVKKFEELIPFSYGKRACVGETLAKFELFLYFVTILQKYTIKLPPETVSNFDAELGINLQPIQKPIFIFEKRF